MLLLLPPSETKVVGGDQPPLVLDELCADELNPARRKLIDALVTLAGDVPASLDALGLSPRQEGEVARNAELCTSPTLPALARYTGVLYDALDVRSMTAAQFDRACRRLAVASALFGVVRGDDPIPAYRLSAGSTVPGIGGLRGFWRSTLEPALSDMDTLLLDLRSGPYAALARIPRAITVTAVDAGTGRRTTIGHFNKAHKGRLARALAVSRREPRTVDDVLEIAGAAGIELDRTGERSIDLVVAG